MKNLIPYVEIPNTELYNEALNANLSKNDINEQLFKDYNELFGDTSAALSSPNGLFQLSLSQDQLKILTTVMEEEKWFHHESGLDQKLAFGANAINKEVISLFKTLLMTSSCTRSWIDSRNPPGFEFNQMIANYYSKGDSVMDHIDLLRFQDGILICNVIGNATIQFKHLDFTHWMHEIELRQGHVLFLTGSSRYDWTHGILPINCTKRISITLRQIIPD